MPRRIQPSQIADVLPRGARVLVQGGAGESAVLADAIEALGLERPDLSFLGVFIPGVNERTYGAEHGRALTTFFLTGALKRIGDNVQFLPLAYTEILQMLRAEKIDAAIFTASLPDERRACSFGVAVDFLAELWPQIPVRVAHLNAAMPRTHGWAGIPYGELSAVVELDAPLLELREGAADGVSDAIAERAASFVENGGVVQAGIGRLPGACMRALSRKRDLRIHSGFVSDWAVDLLEAGALTPGAPITTGLAIGSTRLYAAAASPQFVFKPVSCTHSASVMAWLSGLVTVNAALEVDLLGQGYAECRSDGLSSGPGGSTDFARGAKLAGGTRMVVLPAEAKGGAVTRIVAPGEGRGPVSLSRFDIDVVVTQHGAADLRCCSHDERARRLIMVASPVHREALQAAWRRYSEAAR
ncbi:acetyl-CoA hydrolase/transferase C-terminal domain-containing protein [Terricaulis silvestris]|uniref:Propionyl-CoA:succinate CoA transferase n=1 Tax=Terricaulis silvestris TaxID=2686094 RepID=A0A6I6MQ52_9CAUL|nr:acetyl-CoA hydrolase/transferase C-terminal domain-containing protein [Terricaulis silvestris]QGZ93662.1 Propionyl-CoA:succinate CoA transferase [Terricaulis silvestris]